MKKTITTVKNPLTVIAIFAGTAEISGTAILPFLEATNQQTYMWFLILFPFILIVLFFMTLNWNHNVLYAPSDFSDEDNFFRSSLRKTSAQEQISVLQSNIYEEDITLIGDTKIKNSKDNKLIKTTKEERQKRSELLRGHGRQRIQEIRFAELLVINKLEKEFNIPIEREMKLEVGGSSIIFDGVIRKGPNLIGIDIKYLRDKNSLNESLWKNLVKHFGSLFQSLNEKQKKYFSIIFVVITDSEFKEIRSFLNERFKHFNFPVDIRIYDFDELMTNN